MGKLALVATAAVAAVGLLALARAQPIGSASPPALLTYAALVGGPNAPFHPTLARDAICVARADGSRRRRLLVGRYVREPAWSPNGRFLAFTRVYRHPKVDRQDDIWIADARGRIIRNFSLSPAAIKADPAWSPDGKQIVFTVGGRGGSTIALADADGWNERYLPASGGYGTGEGVGSPAWSPDGRRIVYDGPSGSGSGADVYVIDADGGQLPQLLVRNAVQPAYSPDGSKIAYVAVDYQHTGGDIVVANADGSDPHVITDTQADLHPAWSPDGTRLAFDRLQNARYTIVVANTDGSDARTVISSRSYQAVDPTWRPPTALPTMKRPTCRLSVRDG